MAPVNFGRIKKSLDSLSSAQLQELRDDINTIQTRREKTKQNEFIVLPGTDLKTPNSERAILTERAKIFGLHNGFFEAWELMQYRDALSIGFFEMLYEGLLPLFGYVVKAEKLASEIAGYVRQRAPDEPLYRDVKRAGQKPRRIYPFDETHAGKLAEVIVEIRIIAEQMNAPAIEILEQLTAMTNGVYRLINAHDNGAALRSAVANYEGMESLGRWIESYRPPGARRNAVITRLCDRAATYYEDGLDWDAIVEKITWDCDEENTPQAMMELDQFARWDEMEKSDAVTELRRAFERRIRKT